MDEFAEPPMPEEWDRQPPPSDLRRRAEPTDRSTERVATEKRRPINGQPMSQPAARMPPAAIEVEQQVLGAMLIENPVIPEVLDILSPDDFYDPNHLRIMEAVVAVFERGHPVDLITVSEELKRLGTYEQVGGYALTGITTNTASAANAEYHARIIKEKAILRRSITVLTTMVGEAFDPTTDAFDFIDELEGQAYQLGQLKQSNVLRRAGTAADEVLQEWEDIGAGRRRLGLATGYRLLDRTLGGWVGGRHYVIGAASKTGKTLLALDIARHVATPREVRDAEGALRTEPGVGVLYITVEQSLKEVAQALLIKDGQLQASRAVSGALSAQEWEHARQVAAELKRKPILVMDTARPTIDAIEARSRHAVAQEGVGLIIVDYIQRVRGSNPRAHRSDQVSESSARLKGLARELDVPVISLSQITGDATRKAIEGHIPTSNDLFYSSELKNDADGVVMFYRPEVHGLEYFEPLSLHTSGLGIMLVDANRFGPMPEQCVVHYSSNTITILDKKPPPPPGSEYVQTEAPF